MHEFCATPQLSNCQLSILNYQLQINGISKETLWRQGLTRQQGPGTHTAKDPQGLRANRETRHRQPET